MLCLLLNQVDRMAKKSTFSLFPPCLELVMPLVHLKKPNRNYHFSLPFYLIVLPVMDKSGHYTEYHNNVGPMHQVNTGRAVITAPVFTSSEPMKRFQCCVTILDWQKMPQELQKYRFWLLALKPSNDAPILRNFLYVQEVL